MNAEEYGRIMHQNRFAVLHKDFDHRLLSQIRSQDYALVKNVSTPEARRLYEMDRQVCFAIHRFKGFARFNISKHGILYTKLDLEHDIIRELLHYFHSRFPIFYVAIEDDGKTGVIDTDGAVTFYGFGIEDTLRILESRLPANEFLQNISFDGQDAVDSEALWSRYYDSQYIKERRNMKLRDRLMPKKYQGDTEKNTGKRCMALSDFS